MRDGIEAEEIVTEAEGFSETFAGSDGVNRQPSGDSTGTGWRQVVSYMDNGAECRLELGADELISVRDGTTLILREGEEIPSTYRTPYGCIDIRTVTTSLRVRDSGHSTMARAVYRVLSGDEALSEVNLRIFISFIHQQ